MDPFPSALIDAARRGEAAAWDRLLRAHQLPLYTYAAELIRDRHAAFDIVQETFAAAVKHIGGLRDDRRFASWLFGIAHQRALHHLRRHRRHEARFAPEPTDADGPVDADLPDIRDELIRGERAVAFFALVEQLPPPQRSALLLHVVEEFSLEDIAAITDTPLGTVKSRLHHARRALRRLVESHHEPLTS